MSKPPPPAPTASAIGPCPTMIKIVGRPGTGSLPSTIAPPDHPQFLQEEHLKSFCDLEGLKLFTMKYQCKFEENPFVGSKNILLTRL